MVTGKVHRACVTRIRASQKQGLPAPRTFLGHADHLCANNLMPGFVRDQQCRTVAKDLRSELRVPGYIFVVRNHRL